MLPHAAWPRGRGSPTVPQWGRAWEQPLSGDPREQKAPASPPLCHRCSAGPFPLRSCSLLCIIQFCYFFPSPALSLSLREALRRAALSRLLPAGSLRCLLSIASRLLPPCRGAGGNPASARSGPGDGCWWLWVRDPHVPQAAGSRGSASGGEKLAPAPGQCGERARIPPCPEGEELLLPSATSPPRGGIWIGSGASEQPRARYLREISREIGFVAGVSQLKKLRQR